MAPKRTGSSSVESDFSILKYNKRDSRSCLADISVEGEFHVRQWSEVEPPRARAEEPNFINEAATPAGKLQRTTYR